MLCHTTLFNEIINKTMIILLSTCLIVRASNAVKRIN